MLFRGGNGTVKIDISAVIEIAILYLAIYGILKSAKGTRFGQALLGVGVLAGISALFSFVLHFDVLSKIVHMILVYLALSTVVIFQPEIRRILATVGAFGSFERPKYDADGAADPELVVRTIMSLAHERVGALIAFERGISLRGYEETGVRLDALFSHELLRSIFAPPLPLHDGGLTLRNGRVSCAHCLFPVSHSPHLAAGGIPVAFDVDGNTFFLALRTSAALLAAGFPSDKARSDWQTVVLAGDSCRMHGGCLLGVTGIFLPLVEGYAERFSGCFVGKNYGYAPG